MPSLTNLLTVFEQATPQEVIEGLAWYDKAHKRACALQGRYGVSLDVVVGVIGALSPRSRWERNLSDAERVIAAYVAGEDPLAVPVGTFNRNKGKGHRHPGSRHPARQALRWGGKSVPLPFGGIFAGLPPADRTERVEIVSFNATDSVVAQALELPVLSEAEGMFEKLTLSWPKTLIRQAHR